MLNSSYNFGLAVLRDTFTDTLEMFFSAHLQLFEKIDSKKGALVTFLC